VRWLRPEYSTVDPCPQTLQEEIGNPYEIEGETVYCNLSPAFLRYTFRLVDPTKYPPPFVEAFSWHLAVRLAMPLTRDPNVCADASQLAMRMQAAAEAAEPAQVDFSESRYCLKGYKGMPFPLPRRRSAFHELDRHRF